MKYEVKKDKFTKARGGSAKIYIISCVNCNNEIFLYQKDGVGNLLRLYLDKFIAPLDFVAQLKIIKSKNEMSGLKCPKCGELLAVPMVYEKENRLAYRIIHNKISKKEKSSPLEFNL